MRLFETNNMSHQDIRNAFIMNALSDADVLDHLKFTSNGIETDRFIHIYFPSNYPELMVENGKLKFKIHKCEKFRLQDYERRLTSFEGFPDIIDNRSGSMWVFTIITGNNHSVKTFEHFPQKLNGIDLSSARSFNSLVGIHKRVKRVEAIAMPDTYNSGGLGLLLIKDMEILKIQGKMTPISVKVIIERHLAGDKDVLECQEELIKAGLKEYARL